MTAEQATDERLVLSPTMRKAQLDRRIEQVMAKGQRHIEWRSDYQVVIVRGKNVNHVLHLLVSVFTLGLWLPIWLLLALNGGQKRARMDIDDYGDISITQL